MDGWVDSDLRRWKSLAGEVSSLETIAGQRLACPACRADQRVSELTATADQSQLRCESGHTFESGQQPGEDRDFFFGASPAD